MAITPECLTWQTILKSELTQGNYSRMPKSVISVLYNYAPQKQDP